MNRVIISSSAAREKIVDVNPLVTSIVLTDPAAIVLLVVASPCDTRDDEMYAI